MIILKLAKLAPLSYFKGELHRKRMARKIGLDILNEIKELEFDYMEHDYMGIRGHRSGHGTSKKTQGDG